MNYDPEDIRKFFSNTVLEEKAMTNELALLFRTSNSKNAGEIIREVIIPALSQSDRSLNLLPVPTLVERLSALDSAAMLCDPQAGDNSACRGVGIDSFQKDFPYWFIRLPIGDNRLRFSITNRSWQLLPELNSASRKNIGEIASVTFMQPPISKSG